MNPIRKLLAALLLALSVSGAVAQNDAQIREQKRIIASLEKRIAAEEREISKLRQGRTSTEERIRRLARQIDSRTQLLDATEKEASLLREEIARKDSVAGGLSAALDAAPERTLNIYMDREAPFAKFVEVMDLAKVKREGRFVISTEPEPAASPETAAAPDARGALNE